MMITIPSVAVVGAGPAGIFAARELASKGVRVALFNRDIKPGGLAEYGIYPTKVKMKEGLRSQFRQILALDNIEYFGNVRVAQDGILLLDDIRQLGFHAILVTCGAQGTKWLNLPGEHLRGVYHAKDLVFRYNLLPPFSEQPAVIGKRVAVIGAGNVMMDITRWLIFDQLVDEVLIIVRRGPAEVKFDKKEVQEVAGYIDMSAYNQELARVEPLMRAIGQDPIEARRFMDTAVEKAVPGDLQGRIRMRFLASPTAIIPSESGGVAGLEVEHNVLALDGDVVKARGTGSRSVLFVDTVVFAIGDQVDETLGLPVQRGEFVKAPTPRYPQDGQSYEVYDPEKQQIISDVFMAGWARKASSGLVGVARKDGVNGAQAVLAYLESLPQMAEANWDGLYNHLKIPHHPFVTKKDILNLEEAEHKMAVQLGLESYKFKSDIEMLTAAGLLD